MQRYFTLPAFAGESEERAALALLYACLASIAIGILSTTMLLIFSFNPLTPLFGALELAIAGITLLLLRRGQLTAATWIFLGAFWGFLTFLALTGGGVRSPAVFGYVGLILVAGFVAGRRGAVVTLLVTLVSGLVFTWLSVTGRLSPTSYQFSLYSTWLTLNGLAIWSAFVIFVGDRLIERTVTRLRINEQDLAAQADRLRGLNQQLQSEIAERQQALAALQESENRFRVLAEQTPVGIVIFRDETIVYANPTFCRYAGIEQQDLNRFDPWSLVPRNARELARRTAYTEDGRLRLDQPLEIPIHHGDAPPIWLDVRLHEIIYDGEPALLASTLDMTARRHMELLLRQERSSLAQRVAERTAALQQANDDLAYALQIKDQFMAAVNHELRTPLTSILLKAEVLSAGTYGPLAPQQLEAVDTIIQRANHLQTLVQDVLYLARSGAGQSNMVFDFVPLRTVCDALLDLLGDQLAAKSLTFERRCNLSQLLWTDDQALRVVLFNLVSNAIKFTPAGGTIEIRLTPEPENERIHIAVVDTGIGIDPQQFKVMFEPFVRVYDQNNLQIEGYGLGLTIVAQLVADLGGTVRVESSPGAGSTFTLILPWRDDLEERVLAGEDPLLGQWQPPNDGKACAGMQILLAEDSPVVVETLRHYLESWGCTVTVVTDGVAAVQEARLQPYDIVLLDLQLPRLNGFEAARRLTQEETPLQAPIVALSAIETARTADRAAAAGAVAVLTKPIRPEILYRTLLKEGRHRPVSAD